MKEWTSPDGRMRLINGDCMEFMRGLPDKAFQLAIVDPPYGIGISSNPIRQRHEKKAWGSEIPNEAYFKELFRVSQNQIVWGGNYFSLPASQGFLIWDKIQPHDFSLAMCEYAWTSFQKPAKIWKKSVLAEKNKIHPTQKPVALYRWLFQNYAKAGDRILDTHVGSASSFIAAWEKGFEITGCELDGDYFDAAVARIEKAMQQPSLPFATLTPLQPQHIAQELF